MHSCQWIHQWAGDVTADCNSRMTARCPKISCVLRSKRMHQNSFDGAAFYSRAVILTYNRNMQGVFSWPNRRDSFYRFAKTIWVIQVSFFFSKGCPHIPFVFSLCWCYFACHQVGFTALSIRLRLLFFKCKHSSIFQNSLQRQMVGEFKGGGVGGESGSNRAYSNSSMTS